MTFPLVSVIVPTYAREEPLRDTLEDLLEQDYPHFEVLVVDQTQQHQPQVQAYLQQVSNEGKIQWFRVNWSSLPGARNYGVRRARGEIILFIDDDVQLPEGFLHAHVRNFQSRPEVGAVAGRIFDRMKLAESQGAKQIEELPPQAMDPAVAWYQLDLVHTVKPQWVISARGCNMSFRRELFDRYAMAFDERFQGSAVREESDFCLGLRRTGYKVWYDPEAHLVHLGEPTGGCHDISTRSLQYQITFYHNHFLMACKHLSFVQWWRFAKLIFDCQVLGQPPCQKSGSLVATTARGGFYLLGMLRAIATMGQSLWDDGQRYSRQDDMYLKNRQKNNY
jgi:GT2 family glycosyltransferase